MSEHIASSSAGLSQFGALSNLLNVGVLLLSPSSALEFANGLACELLGYTEDSVLKEAWDTVKRQLQMDAMLEKITKPRAYKVDFPGAAQLRLLRLEVYALDEDSCSGYLVLLRDRRVAHILESDLLLASQMRAQNYMYSALIHDLRAPLNAMTITLELLADTAVADDRIDSTERYVGVLREELARLNRLLSAVLGYSAPLREERRQFDLLELLRDLVELLAPQARHQRIDLQLRQPSCNARVEGLRDSIKQALLNVVINALEAMQGQKHGRLDIDLEMQGGAAKIVFTDSGPGVPGDLLDDIYGVYFTTKKTGSGMGLYVTRLVVEAHDGDIHVENGPTGGARFVVTLPLA
jgi:signal transduction histidine kinase